MPSDTQVTGAAQADKKVNAGVRIAYFASICVCLCKAREPRGGGDPVIHGCERSEESYAKNRSENFHVNRT